MNNWIRGAYPSNQEQHGQGVTQVGSFTRKLGRFEKWAIVREQHHLILYRETDRHTEQSWSQGHLQAVQYHGQWVHVIHLLTQSLL
jgi:hypothetical protein